MATPPDAVKELVERFERNAASYRNPAYRETELRVELVNPFWQALGWDMDNRAGYAMAYRDVVHEDALKVGAASKAPDYSFRIGGQRKFFLETKKPAINLRDDPAPAYQLRRYGWSAHLAVSVLTNFDELAIYDCRIQPKLGDKPHVARMALYTAREYLTKWEEIAGIFAREAVLKGAFDQWAETAKGKRGTLEVDEAFLQEIEAWRDELARNLALRNPALDSRDLNFAVQRTIDRLVFLRLCEARGIERYGQLQALGNGPRIYPRLLDIYRRADEKYNSGLFHFQEEKDRPEAPDTLTPRLEIDDKTLKGILARLYYPESPYEFSILPAEILGNVYEQFLGKVIRLTAGHQAKVEEKPEVRKAGGVYYTPAYIVDYIVRHTVGQLCEGQTPREVSRLRILDPACGSGSFLLGAYQYLLDWHLRWYRTEQERKGVVPQSPPADGQRRRKGDAQAVYQGKGGEWHLTTAEKKRILLNNIHGVDIDAQAVEVTKLSLLLKVLENENQETLGRNLELWHDRALPDLAGNIKCGNSLIGPDFYLQPRQATLFADEDARLRVNAFDWQDPAHGFGAILQAGGFDAVIGNPPYGATFLPEEREYLLHFDSRCRDFPDSYCLFMSKAVRLSKPNGFLAMIVPNTFCDLESCENFRKWLLRDITLRAIRQTGWAFRQAVVDTIIFVARNSPSKSQSRVWIETARGKHRKAIRDFLASHLCKIDFRTTDTGKRVLQALLARCAPLRESACVRAGVKLYEEGKGQPPQRADTLEQRPFTTKGRCPKGWMPLYRGSDITRYALAPCSEFVRYGAWLAAPREPELFESPKILMRRTDDRLLSCIERDRAICVNSCHVIKLLSNSPEVVGYEYLLGILNSKLLQYVFAVQNPQMQGKVFAEIKVVYVERLPLCRMDLSRRADRTRHDRMVALVQGMLALHKRREETRTPEAVSRLERDIASLDQQIDALVYELYGLTEEDIRIVETEI